MISSQTQKIFGMDPTIGRALSREKGGKNCSFSGFSFFNDDCVTVIWTQELHLELRQLVETVLQK